MLLREVRPFIFTGLLLTQQERRNALFGQLREERI
jgi:hypothetical protein